MLTTSLMMGGGSKKIKSVLASTNSIQDKLNIIIMLILLFIFKALVVQWSYNKVAPRLISNWGHPIEQFRPLTFEEALLFTLFITFLF